VGPCQQFLLKDTFRSSSTILDKIFLYKSTERGREMGIRCGPGEREREEGREGRE